MKKIIVAILAIAILGCAIWGITAIVKAKKSDNSGNEKNVTYRVDLMEDEYTVGEKIILRVIATSDVQFTSIKYSINNGTATAFSVTSGESKDFEEAIGDGKYYVDSGAEMIDTSTMTPGYYTLVIYASDADEATYTLTKDPIVFKLNEATAN